MARSPKFVSAFPKRLRPAANRLYAAFKRTKRQAERWLREWFPSAPAVTPIPIAEFMTEEHRKLLELQTRQYFIEAVIRELDKVRRGREFTRSPWSARRSRS